MRASSPLFSVLTHDSKRPQTRCSPNHTTYWIRLVDMNIDAIEYLRTLNKYNYVLIVERPYDLERIHICIQYQNSTTIDIKHLPFNSSIREIRSQAEDRIRTLKSDSNVIEEGGAIDYELIRRVDEKEAYRIARSTSPI